MKPFKIIVRIIPIYIIIISLCIIGFKIFNPDVKWAFFWPPNDDKLSHYHDCYMQTLDQKWYKKADSMRHIMFNDSFWKVEKDSCDCK